MRKYSFSILFAMVFLLVYVSTPDIHAAGKQIYQVGTDKLNVRTAPDDQAEVIGELHSGDQVTGFQEKHGWMQTYYEGKAVWVASQYLVEMDEPSQDSKIEQSTKTVTIQEDAVHLRSGPDTDTTILKIARKGDTYDVIDTSDDWHKIKLTDGTTAWVASWLTDQPTTSKEKPGNTKQADTPAKMNKTTSSHASGQALAGYNIILDPSHGGEDPGAIGMNGEMEKDLALDFTNTLAEKLRNEGATVLLTRSTDSYVSLGERVRISNAYATDAFISIHFNAFTTSASNGVSTHYYSGGNDYRLAQQIQNGLDQHSSFSNRGVRQDNYYVLRENNDASVLLELGFMTNPSDLQLIHSAQHATAVADGIAEGLINYFN